MTGRTVNEIPARGTRQIAGRAQLRAARPSPTQMRHRVVGAGLARKRREQLAQVLLGAGARERLAHHGLAEPAARAKTGHDGRLVTRQHVVRERGLRIAPPEVLERPRRVQDLRLHPARRPPARGEHLRRRNERRRARRLHARPRSQIAAERRHCQAVRPPGLDPGRPDGHLLPSHLEVPGSTPVVGRVEDQRDALRLAGGHGLGGEAREDPQPLHRRRGGRVHGADGRERAGARDAGQPPSHERSQSHHRPVDLGDQRDRPAERVAEVLPFEQCAAVHPAGRRPERLVEQPHDRRQVVVGHRPGPDPLPRTHTRRRSASASS